MKKRLPTIVTFRGVKGGVGTTSAVMKLAKQLVMRERKNVLVVDASGNQDLAREYLQIPLDGHVHKYLRDQFWNGPHYLNYCTLSGAGIQFFNQDKRGLGPGPMTAPPIACVQVGEVQGSVFTRKLTNPNRFQSLDMRNVLKSIGFPQKIARLIVEYQTTVPFRTIQPLPAVQLNTQNPGVFLVPGECRMRRKGRKRREIYRSDFASFSRTLDCYTGSWTRFNGTGIGYASALGIIREMLQLTARRYKCDYVLIDCDSYMSSSLDRILHASADALVLVRSVSSVRSEKNMLDRTVPLAEDEYTLHQTLDTPYSYNKWHRSGDFWHELIESLQRKTVPDEIIQHCILPMSAGYKEVKEDLPFVRKYYRGKKLAENPTLYLGSIVHPSWMPAGEDCETEASRRTYAAILKAIGDLHRRKRNWVSRPRKRKRLQLDSRGEGKGVTGSRT